MRGLHPKGGPGFGQGSICWVPDTQRIREGMTRGHSALQLERHSFLSNFSCINFHTLFKSALLLSSKIGEKKELSPPHFLALWISNVYTFFFFLSLVYNMFS